MLELLLALALGSTLNFNQLTLTTSLVVFLNGYLFGFSGILGIFFFVIFFFVVLLPIKG